MEISFKPDVSIFWNYLLFLRNSLKINLIKKKIKSKELWLKLNKYRLKDNSQQSKITKHTFKNKGLLYALLTDVKSPKLSNI